MIFDSILDHYRIAAFQKLLEKKEKILVEELWNGPKALLAVLIQQFTNKNILILTGASQEEMRLYHDLAFFSSGSIIDFPSWETMPSEEIAPSPDIVGERYKVLHQLSSSQDQGPCIVLASLQAALQKLIDPFRFSQLQLKLKKGEIVEFAALIEKLMQMGYQQKPIASDKGEFAVRGGIIDIFPISLPEPYRLEFWGDELESLRIYDPIGQRSVKPVEEVELLPAQELQFLRSEPKMATLLDYLGRETFVIFDDMLALENRYASLVSLGQNHPFFSSIEEFLDRLEQHPQLLLSSKAVEELSKVHYLTPKGQRFYSKTTLFQELKFEMFQRSWHVQRWRHPFQTITDSLFEPEETPSSEEIVLRLTSLPKSTSLHFLTTSEIEKTNLQKKIAEFEVTLPINTHYHSGYLSCGFALKESDFLLLPTTELTQRYKMHRPKLRSHFHAPMVETFDLSPGDLVVHFNNGIGRYLGLEKKPNHLGTLVEFMVVEYAEHSKLYVPLNQAHLITKYVGSQEERPKLNTLGSGRWKKAKEQTERAILGYAADLLKSYALRSIKKKEGYPIDSADMKVFEEEFPFTETEDQVAAVQAIKEDMMSSQVMDRLVCGDVGYGKTEVAMRAAFKAVVDGGKQVAVLVPTTILAMQHYENFVERMKDFPITVGQLSRFCSAKQMKKTLEGIETGSIDIVIGTHRLISQDVVFKELGLVIIDEEQRFGVKAKEHLKKMKGGVNCLTLSATPIPRTLYMSLIGARDLSVINTPPQDRLPIKTVLTDASDQVIKNAILRELNRDGQLFFIHNRVETIYSVADRIKALVPQARLIVAHGQMSAHEIDSAFHLFKSGVVDILVATTIIENGVDIPNANTILIDQADRFGLATLYQMRGRVGRWNRRAYAYFMVKNLYNLSELSRKRLSALAESTGYGAGMKLAMRDLEIRGAGDILGIEQSGHVSAIGFHLYCKLLKRTIKALQGQVPSVLSDPKIDLKIDARLSEEYIFEVSLRMEIYQRLGEAISLEELEIIWAEMIDRFGAPPESALYLYHLTHLRIYASLNGFTLLKQEKMFLTMEKQKGKETFVKKVLMPKFKSPQEFKEKMMMQLQAMPSR